MTAQEAIAYIENYTWSTTRLGLDRTRELLYKLGDPQKRLKFVHVAGSNGKGSTCAMLDSILRAAGYRTGLYTSPYIQDFCERMRVDGENIPGGTLARLTERVKQIADAMEDHPSQFELVTAIAMQYFLEAGCEIVVLEVGMGGLLDSTNVILPPLCAVIATIGLDHTAILGDTIAAIAEQKCGILKEGSLAVTSAQCEEAIRVIRDTAAQRNIPLIESGSVALNIKEISLGGSVFDYLGEEMRLRLAGDHQIENAKTALAAIAALTERSKLNISRDNIKEGLKNAVNPARLETLHNNPLVILDGAHNPNGIEALKKAIDRFLGGRKIVCMMGMLADKDIDSALALLDGVFDAIYTVPIDNPRALSSKALAEKCRTHAKEVQAFDSAENGFDAAYAKAESENAALLICGSLYLAGAVRPYIIEKFS